MAYIRNNLSRFFSGLDFVRPLINLSNHHIDVSPIHFTYALLLTPFHFYLFAINFSLPLRYTSTIFLGEKGQIVCIFRTKFPKLLCSLRILAEIRRINTVKDEHRRQG
jgi:hypothetical protein